MRADFYTKSLKLHKGAKMQENNKNSQNLVIVKAQILKDFKQRVADKIMEQENFNLLERLISYAQNEKEAQDIASLGTKWVRTGFHFDFRAEKSTDEIAYLKRNENLSFTNDNNKPTHTLIIGDNYPALLNLLIAYREKIKVIYIDPPYGKDNLGEFADTNYNNAITRDNLLSMLKPRLELAKMLLRDDGVIFCSIDDRNQAYLKCLFDEIFGERNFISNFIWEKTQHFGRQKLNYYSNSEYILCYAKKLYDGDKQQRLLIENIQTEFDDAPLYNASNNKHTMTFPKNSCIFNIKDGIYAQSDEQDKYELLNSVIIKNQTNENEFQIRFKSRWSNQTLQDELEKGAKVLIKSTKFSPRMIYADNKEFIVSPKTLIFTNDKNPFCAKFKNIKVGTNENGSAEISNILSRDIFEYPKPTSLLCYLIGISTTPNNPDFNGGGGATRPTLRIA